VTWQSGVVTNVGSSEGHSYNRVQGVNEAGSMVGFAWNLFQPNDSVVFDGSKWATIGGFGQFQNAEASDLNDTGMVVGLQAFPSGSWHAAAWIFGQPEALDLGTLSGLDTGEMYGVNDAGMAVGSSYDSGLPGQNRAILWDGTTLHDLNDLVTVPPGAVLYEARDINEHGDVAGTALIDGNFRAFLLVRDTLASQTTELSLASGGQQDLALEGGSLRAGWFYWVFGSATGTSPGLDFGGGVVLPLNFDAYFNLTLTKPGLGAFGDFIGQLDGAGDAAATLTIPSGVDPSLAGVTLHHAFLAAEVLGFADFASNPVAVTLAP
jgi:uncharacterized membrane protein